jgi:FtsP/CotA-like multicopper oxidase with cupredoxin domain
MQEVVLLASHVVQDLPAHRLHGLTQGWAAGLEIAYRLRQGCALVGVIALHLLVTHGTPSVDSPNDRREDGVFVVDVLYQHAIEVFGVGAQSIDVLQLLGGDRQREPVNLGYDGPQLRMVSKNSGSHVAHRHTGRFCRWSGYHGLRCWLHGAPPDPTQQVSGHMCAPTTMAQEPGGPQGLRARARCSCQFSSAVLGGQQHAVNPSACLLLGLSAVGREKYGGWLQRRASLAWFGVTAVFLVAPGCSSNANVALPASGSAVSLAEAVDRNPDPSIVEIDLEARLAQVELAPGLRPTVRTYNGSLPGPLIRAKIGDRVIAHFKNSLPDPTTIHWHGVRVPVNMDGTPMSQDPVMPGQTFDYDFHVPDASLFWYHAHVDSAVQVSEGLYGPLVVEDPSQSDALGDEVILVLSDIALDGDGGLAAPIRGNTVVSLFGAEGQTILVNGKVHPRLTARAGVRQRWRLVNAAGARFFHLVLDGHSLTRIGGDGGLIESPVPGDSLVLAPGERADVSIVPHGNPGTDVALHWISSDRGFGTDFGEGPQEILTLHIENVPAATPTPLPEHLRTIQPLDVASATPQNVVIAYAEGVDGGPPPANEGYTINGKAFDAMLMGRVDETDVFTVDNRTDWDHPFHLHGFFFQPLDESGLPVHEWKDTFNIPVKSTRRFVVHYDDRAGNWMFHCHVLDHTEVGLMGMLMLEK